MRRYKFIMRRDKFIIKRYKLTAQLHQKDTDRQRAEMCYTEAREQIT